MHFTLLLSNHIASFGKPRVPAVDTGGMVGHYVDGKCLTPDAAAVRAALPYRYRKAFDRAGGCFWFNAHDNWAPSCLRLIGSRGQWLNTVYAILGTDE